MFKRQFYALEHSNRDDSASSSSLATDSDGRSGSDLEDDGAWPESSHESDTSAEEELDPSESGKLANRPVVSGDGIKYPVANPLGRPVQESTDLSKQWAQAVDEDEQERIVDKFEGTGVICLGPSEHVLKCRLCPKIICLSEESMKAHLHSKGHARSLKQLASGKLKVQLDSDGEEDEEGETHAERFARTMNVSQVQQKVVSAKRKQGGGRQRQRKRLKRKALVSDEAKRTTDMSSSQAAGIDGKPSVSNGLKTATSSSKRVVAVTESRRKENARVTSANDKMIQKAKMKRHANEIMGSSVPRSKPGKGDSRRQK